MGWSGQFGAFLASPVREPRYILESIDNPNWQSGRSTLAVSSHHERGYIGGIISRSLRLSGGEAHPGDWSYTMGQMQVDLVPSTDWRQYVVRGGLVALRLGFGGLSPEDYQTVFLGTVVDLQWTQRPARWILTLREAVAALVSRWTEEFGAEALFSDAFDSDNNQVSTVVTATTEYTAGASSFTVNDTSDWDRETGGDYLLRMTPDSGDDFYLRAASKSAGSFTGITLGTRYGTSSADASAGQPVYYHPLIEGHPVLAMAKVLTSTGAGTNGAYDTLPAAWGLGIDRALVDIEQIELTKKIVDVDENVTEEWEVRSDSRQANVLGWISSVLAPMGGFLCTRQGRLVIRAGVTQDVTTGYGGDATIDDREIVSIQRYSTWDRRLPVEYHRLRSSTEESVFGTTETEAVDTRPVLAERYNQIPYVNQDNGGDVDAWEDWANQTAHVANMRIPETIEIVAIGWRLALMSPGDLLHVNTRWVSSRVGGQDTFKGGPIVVTMVEPDWMGNTVRIRGHAIPSVAYELE